MKKSKVAVQFIIELFIVTFAALIIGSGIGAVSSVPITNSLLSAVNSESAEASVSDLELEKPQGENGEEVFGTENGINGEMPNKPDMNDKGGFERFKDRANNYVASVSAATDITVIGQMIVVGLVLTLISSLSAMLFIMRYEPLKILSNRE